MTADRSDALMLDLVVGVAEAAARRTGHVQVVMRSPAAWHVRDAARPAPAGFAWVLAVCPDHTPGPERREEALGLMKTIHGRRHMCGWPVPPQVPVADPRVVARETPAPPPPAFHVAPEPAPAPKGTARQASLFGDDEP